MAMTKRRRFTARRGRRAPLRWTAQNINVDTTITDVASGTGTLVGFGELISPADYRQTAALEPDGATVVRMIGHVSVDAVWQAESLDPSEVMPVRCNPAIILLSTNETFPLFSVQSLIDRRYIWWKDHSKVLGNAPSFPGTQTPVVSIAAAAVGLHQELAFNWEFDIRARVKLQQLQSIQWGVSITVGATLAGDDSLFIQGDCICRSLLKGSF